jgi:hypothetical protein
MADGQGGTPPPDLQAIARDWVTIWQSELSAMASDRELQNAWIQLVGTWSNAAELMTRLLPAGRHDTASGCAGAASPAGSAAPVAPSDDRDAAIQRLADRVADLERRLAASGHGNGSSNGGNTST